MRGPTTMRMFHEGTIGQSLVYRDVTEATPRLAKILLDQPEATTRNGKAQELLFPHIELKQPRLRANLALNRRASLPAQIYETMWVLSGASDVSDLSDYLPRATDFADDGVHWRGAYGPRLRGRTVPGKDPLLEVIRMLKDNPSTRRAVISIYDTELDCGTPSKDIPCNDTLHFMSHEGQLDLHIFTRSNDLIWGWSGINTFEWSVLLEIVATYAGLEVGSLHFSISNLHLYGHHVAKAQKIVEANELAPRLDTAPGPTFDPPSWDLSVFNDLLDEWFDIEGEIRGLLNRHEQEDESRVLQRISLFPEPMMQSFLSVLFTWWAGDRGVLPLYLVHTDLYYGLQQSPRAKRTFPSVVVNPYQLKPTVLTVTYDVPGIAQTVDQPTLPGMPERKGQDFREFVKDLHWKKDAAYRDSWKRRGEQLSIQANIARKIDRLETGVDTPDESQVDTAIDLLVYLAKYFVWIYENEDVPLDKGLMGDDERWNNSDDLSDELWPVNAVLNRVPLSLSGSIYSGGWAIRSGRAMASGLIRRFDNFVTQNPTGSDKFESVKEMLVIAASLAYRRWWAFQNSTRSWNPEAGQEDD